MSPVLRFLRHHLKPYLAGTLAGAFLFTIGNSLQAMIFLALKLMFDNQFQMGSGKSTPLPGVFTALASLLPSAQTIQSNILFIPILIAVLFFLRGVFTYAAGVLVARSGSKAVRDLRERLFECVLRQDPVFFHKHPVGELMNRVLGDVGAVQSLASSQISELLKQSSMAIIMVVFIIKTDWHFALALLVFFPCVFLPIRFFSKAVRRQGHKAQGRTDNLLQRLKEVLSNMRVVKAFAREDFENERFKTISHSLYRTGMRVVKIQGLSSPVMETVGGVLLACLAFYGALRIKSGVMTGGGFLMFLLAIYQLYDPLRILTRSYADLQMSSVALERIFGLLDSQPLLVAPPNPQPVPDPPHVIALEGVRFSYGKDEVLKGIDLTVRRGETVALVGGSGGGKTSLVNLIPRFYDPTEGRITVDGIDIREFDPRELRKRIGIVTQETLLFLDTVHDNIAYGMTASREAVEAAARKAFAHEFITQMPQGYDSPMAETGATLSGGQRQRIAIARALLQDPPILILDEATSALDTESERAVQAALETLMQDRTTLVIAHRLSTIQRATRICALKHGRIVEQGSHEELLERAGEYARLHALQFHTV
jgi:ATP-binding cassette, subfamily B, bacterial MsbA